MLQQCAFCSDSLSFKRLFFCYTIGSCLISSNRKSTSHLKCEHNLLEMWTPYSSMNGFTCLECENHLPDGRLPFIVSTWKCYNIQNGARKSHWQVFTKHKREREKKNKYCHSYSMDSQVKTYIFEKSAVGDFQQRDTAGNFVVDIVW